jgi:ATP-dependent RNA helicase DHX8/PRP22
MDVLRVNERVFVRVIDAQVTDLSLSMLDIDQATGEPAESGLGRGAVQKLGGVRVPSPDRFELDQLMNAGALRPEDAPEFAHSSMGVLSLVGPLEEEFEIVLNTNVPPFLAGLKRAKRSIDPIRVESNAEGSLGRAARDAALLSRQRVDQRKMTAGLLDDEAPPVIPTVSLSELPEWKRQTFGSFGPRVQKPKNDLPIAFFRERIRQMVNENRVFILIGETGSGKTTQIPQYLHEWGITEKLIAVTQPRRVAAISVAKRVAQEMNTAVGNLVGYCVRFEECVSAATHIRYVTDGMLLKECLTDHSLANYGVVMLDEAHERTIHTDVLFGLMKEILNDESSDLKVIVTSATLQQQKFSEFFNNCPILPIPGRMFPVQVSFATKAFTDYLQASVQAVLALHKSEELPGDILLFLTGQEDIDSACELLYEQGKRMAEEYGELIVLPIYSTLPSEQQSLIFEPTPPNSRKVVVATNIAETSITIDGIRFVVDPGFVKEMWYDSKVGMDTLKIVPISKAAANQRKGRAGRTAPGKCVRLYTQAAYTREMADASIPEIQRSNIAMVALQLKAMGIDNLIAFEFMDKPQTATIVDGLEQLYQLGALDEEGNLTALGLKMAQFPLNPQLSKMLIVSADLGCSRDILALVAILSVQGIWYRPRARQAAADAMKARLDREEGDHITLLHVYKEWLSADRSEQWCRDHFIHYRSLRRAEEVIHQLERLMERFRLPLHSSGTDTQRILKAIVAGFFTRAARKDGQRGYQTLVDNHVVHMFPGSSLFGREPDFVVFHELVNTTREYMRNTIAVDPRWLVELAPAFYRRASPEEITERKRNERLTPLSDNLRRHERDWRITEQRIVRL